MPTNVDIKTLNGATLIVEDCTIKGSPITVDLEDLSTDAIEALMKEYNLERINITDYSIFETYYNSLSASSGGGTTNGLTDTQLRVSPVGVTVTNAVSGAATENEQAAQTTALTSILTELQAKADVTETQPVSASSLPLPTGAATEETLNNVVASISGLGTHITPLTIKNIASVTTPTFSRPTTSGSIPAGKHSVTITNTGSVDGQVLGTVLHKGEMVSFEAIDRNSPLSQIDYIITGGEFTIVTGVVS